MAITDTCGWDLEWCSDPDMVPGLRDVSLAIFLGCAAVGEPVEVSVSVGEDLVVSVDLANELSVSVSPVVIGE